VRLTERVERMREDYLSEICANEAVIQVSWLVLTKCIGGFNVSFTDVLGASESIHTLQH